MTDFCSSHCDTATACRITPTATFSEPGDYVLQVVVDDGSGESAGNFGYHCCWTTKEIKVAAQGNGAKP